MTTYALSLLTAVHTEVIDALGTGGKLALVNSANVLLAEIPLNTPAGIINGVTGQLTISFNGRCESAAASGTIANFQLRTSADAVIITGACRAGTTALADYLTFNSLLTQAGSPVEVSSLTFG